MIAVSWLGGRGEAIASAVITAALATAADAPLPHGPYIYAWNAMYEEKSRKHAVAS